MRKSEEASAWVVYQKVINNKTPAITVVCEQAEWDALELADPGHNTLVKAGITNEAEAELLARTTSGFVPQLRGFAKTRTVSASARPIGTR